MTDRSAVVALLLTLLPGVSCASGHAAPDDQQMVDCRLAPRVIHTGRTTRVLPGRVVRTTKVDCDVRGGLEFARRSIPAALAALHALRCGEARCYSSSEVARAVGKFREQVRVAIPPEAAALALAVDGDLDRASQLGEPLPLNPIQPAQLRPDNAGSGYRSDAVAAAFNKLAEVIDRVLSHPSLAPTLTIRSSPVSAKFVMQAGSVEITQRSGVTDTKLPNVWRGRYSAEARKPGYKTGTMDLDLMNDGRTRIFCELHSEQETKESFCRAEP
jgi:hypothetical protein